MLKDYITFLVSDCELRKEGAKLFSAPSGKPNSKDLQPLCAVYVASNKRYFGINSKF